MTAENGCVNVVNETVDIYPSPIADFTSGSVCEGEPSVFTDLSLPQGTDTLVSWNWDFGDAGTSEERHPNHVFTGSGEYTVTLEISDPHCSASTTASVVVSEAPVLALSSSTNEGCSPLYVNFTAASSDDVMWSFGDGNGANGGVVTHTYLGDPLSLIHI